MEVMGGSQQLFCAFNSYNQDSTVAQGGGKGELSFICYPPWESLASASPREEEALGQRALG